MRSWAAVAFLGTSLLAACDGGGTLAARPSKDGGVADAPVSCPAEDDLSGPDVSFEKDLMPFFSVTCAFGGCHDGNTRQAGLYLGPNFIDGPADAATRSEVLASLLSAATTTPDLPRVAPGDPAGSFLILKIEGCQNRMGLTCARAVPGAPCGDRMPALSAELPRQKRSLLARWIARGASGGSLDAGADGAAAPDSGP